MNHKNSFLEKHLQSAYTFWSKRYDIYVDPRWHFERQTAIEKLSLAPGEKVLEIGVGTGLNLPYYPAGCEVTGIDISTEMLEEARQKKSPAKIVLKHEDARHTSFVDNSFDKALATYVVRVSPNPHQIFQELSRAVKRNGLFCIVDKFKSPSDKLLSKIFLWAVGGGKDYALKELITETPWKIVSDISFGTRKGTRLVVLNNEK